MEIYRTPMGDIWVYRCTVERIDTSVAISLDECLTAKLMNSYNEER